MTNEKLVSAYLQNQTLEQAEEYVKRGRSRRISQRAALAEEVSGERFANQGFSPLLIKGMLPAQNCFIIARQGE